MIKTTLYIARHFRIALTAIVLLAVVSTPALADKSKQGINRARSAVPTDAIKYATPTIGAVEFIVKALGQQPAVVAPADKTKKKVNVARESAEEDSRIVKAHANSAGFTARISLNKDETKLDIGIYNMLGKRMGDVYSGPATKGEHQYTTSTEFLPEGVYICIMQGSDFRRASKFYLNR